MNWIKIASFGALLFSLFLIDGSQIIVAIEKAESLISNWNPAQGPAGTVETAPTGQPSAPLYQWTQLAPNGKLVLRALMAPGVDCPLATSGGAAIPFRPRAPMTAAQFGAVTLCEGAVESGAGIRLADRVYGPLPDEPSSIIILGDTGCRLAYYEHQSCNDGYLWPFARIAELAAAKQPDLVIHVGDYHYREQPCADREAGCSGTPWGDNWAVWKADFFEPAKPLLNAAPWIAVRGNHEDCNRAGYGWFHFLSLRDGKENDTCIEAETTYRLEIGSAMEAIVIDNSWGNPKIFNDGKQTFFEGWQAATRAAIDHHAAAPLRLLLTHVPVRYPWPENSGEGEPFCNTKGGKFKYINGKYTKVEDAYTLQTMSENVAYWLKSSSYSPQTIVVSGDSHNFMSIPQKGSFHQLVVGGGGTYLDDPDKLECKDIKDGDFQIFSFNYMHLLKFGPGWRGIVYDEHDKVLAACAFAPAPATEGPATASNVFKEVKASLLKMGKSPHNGGDWADLLEKHGCYPAA